MRKQIFTNVILIVAVALCAANVHSQQTEDKRDADAALREKAFDLLKSLAAQLGTLQSAENRARMGSNIAGSLWTKLLEELKHLNAFPQAKDRTMFLMSLANRAGPSESKTVLKVLNQASEIVDSMKPGREKDDAQLRLAVLYCLQKNDRGLAMMESMIPRLTSWLRPQRNWMTTAPDIFAMVSGI